MPGVDLNVLKLLNARFKSSPPANQQAEQPLRQEVQNDIAMAGGDPTQWDYPTGATVMNAATGNTTSTSFDCGKEFFRNDILVRVKAVGTTTATCTYAMQGSMDGNTWLPVYYVDVTTPGTLSNAAFTLTPVSTTVTVIKRVYAGQEFKYLQVVTSSNTNVTNTVDVTTVP